MPGTSMFSNTDIKQLDAPMAANDISPVISDGSNDACYDQYK